MATDVHPYIRHVNPDLADMLARLRLDKRFVRGEGCELFDAAGRRYLDCIAAYGALRLATTLRRSGVRWRSCVSGASPASCSHRCSMRRGSSRPGWWSSPPRGFAG